MFDTRTYVVASCHFELTGNNLTTQNTENNAVREIFKTLTNMFLMWIPPFALLNVQNNSNRLRY